MVKGYFNLMAFNNAFIEDRVNKAGATIKCVTIPLENNFLALTDKGNVPVNWVAWENDKIKSDHTHLIKLDPGKDVREQLKTAGEYPPTLGALKVDEGDGFQQTGKIDEATMPLPAGDGLPF
jgi:hypothetical protein